MRKVWGAAVALVVAVAVLAGPAAAEDPLFLNWSQLLPGLTPGYDPTSANDCKSGRIQCVDAVVHEMTKRFDRLAAACDHDTLFALSYLRTTEEYRRAATEPGFFGDPGFVNHEDAVFARYYFDAFDAWHRGDVAATPKAWRVALQAADQKAVDGGTNVLLGISAHINRDLPFVLWEIGLVKADGTSRKADHDKVNEFLNRVVLYPEIHGRFDDSVNPEPPAGAIHSIIAMRENAWRNAERLRAAEGNPLLFAAVKKSIEDAAYLEAVAVRDTGRYGWGESSAHRDAYCAARRDA